MIKPQNIITRLIVAFVGIPSMILMILDGHLFFLLFIDLVLFFSLRELYLLAEKKGFYPSKRTGLITILLLSGDIYFFSGSHAVIIFTISILYILCIELYKHKTHSLANSAITLFGIIYISFFSSFLLIRQTTFRDATSSQMGWLIVLLFASIWGLDSGAYFIGSTFGKRKLFKRISPNKTWEGAVGGFFCAILVMMSFRPIFVPFIHWWDALIIGVIIGVVGQLSDLVESLFKRDANVKNSSEILLGHGGMWDRFDSALFVGPFVYLYLLSIHYAIAIF